MVSFCHVLLGFDLAIVNGRGVIMAHWQKMRLL